MGRNRKGFSTSKTPCGEGLVHPRSGGRSSAASQPEGFEEGCEVEGFSPGATESQCAESCANPAKIKPSVSSRGARSSSSQGPTVAGRDQRIGRCRHDPEGESGASRVGADHFYEGFIEREKKRLVAAKEALIVCPESRRVSRSFGTGRETFGRIAVAGEEPLHMSRGRRIRVGSPQSSSGRVSRKSWTVKCERRKPSARETTVRLQH